MVLLGVGCAQILGLQEAQVDPNLCWDAVTQTVYDCPDAGGDGGVAGCTPGTHVQCYDGPPATKDVGICKHGTQECGPDGMPTGACMGEVQPQKADNCAIAEDDNCDGVACSANVGSGVFDAGSTNGVAVDASGNAFVTGYFTGSLTFGDKTLVSAGGSDLFLAKVDPSGKPLWALSFGSVENESQSFVASTPDGGVILAGDLPSHIDLGCGALTNVGQTHDFFIGKLDAGGACKWSKVFGDAPGAQVHSMTVNHAGDLVLAGSIAGSVSFGGAPVLFSEAGQAYVAKLKSIDGSHVWSESFDSSTALTYGSAITVDPSGDVIVFGAAPFDGLTFDGQHMLTKGVFVVRLDSFGAYAWSTSFATPVTMNGDYAASTDTSGNIFLAGQFTNTIQFGQNPALSATAGAWFLAKLDVVSGAPQWSKSFPASGNVDVTVDDDGNIILTGQAQGTLSFGGPTLTTKGNDAVLAKLDKNGGHLWSKVFGDAKDQAGVAVRTVPGSKRIVMAGNAAGQIDFGKGPLTCPGNDVFVATFEP